MRKPVVYLILGVVAVGAGILATLPYALREPDDQTSKGLGGSGEDAKIGQLTILYPLDETLFPPEIAAPTIRWKDSRDGVDGWLVMFKFRDEKEAMSFSSAAMEWTPADEDWRDIKRRSLEKPAELTVLGFSQTDPQRILSQARISISTSVDEVGAPLFFREVNLPFLTAVKDPSAYIRWRFGDISSSKPPPIVLEKLPVCGNCHSFSADGSTLAMEIDSGNDKGAYAIAPVEEEIVLDPSKIITWSDYRREDNEKTFGLLCQASPDGRYIAGTVKDRALAIYRPDLAFSQLFFPVKGMLAIYDRETQTFSALPGADDPRYVQTNGTWSPDGRTIVFSRSHDEAYDPPSLKEVDTVLVPPEQASVFVNGDRKFMYDLYRIPFDNGKGGKAEPIEGASHNGMSNYFPKFSPDGKWIVFCKARSFMLLQPDSELHIIPAGGGEARRLRCNTSRMNSWHSWSPNGKWLVFSSKAYSVYTQLFLTHIDEQGTSTPPVVLSNFTEKNRAANIPEFANLKSGAIKKIRERFLDDTNYLRAGDAFRNEGDFQNAVRLYRKGLEINPRNALLQTNMGISLARQGNLEEAKTHLALAIDQQPDHATAHCNLGIILRQQNRRQEAIESHRRALQIDPDFAASHLHLGTLLLESGAYDEAQTHLTELVRLTPHDPYAHFNLAMVFSRQKQSEQAAVHLGRTLEVAPDFIPALVSLSLTRATSGDDGLRDGEEAVELATRACTLTGNENPEALHALAAAYAEVGQFPAAVSTADRAIRIARTSGNEGLANAIRRPLELYRQEKPFRLNSH